MQWRLCVNQDKRCALPADSSCAPGILRQQIASVLQAAILAHSEAHRTQASAQFLHGG